MSHFKPHVAYEINSKDRDSGSIEDFNKTIHHLTFSQNPDKQYYIRCEDVLLPHSFYNINASNNKLLIAEENGVGGFDSALDIGVSHGNYTISELVTEIESQLDAETGRSNAYTLTYNDITNKILFTFTGATSVSVRVDSVANGSTLNEIVGFTAFEDTTTQTTILVSNVVENIFPVDLDIESYINIRTDLNLDNYYQGNDKINVLCRVPINVDRFEKQYFENTNGILHKISSKAPINSIRLYLEDESGKNANTSPAFSMNDTNFSLKVVIYEWTKPHNSEHN